MATKKLTAREKSLKLQLKTQLKYVATLLKNFENAEQEIKTLATRCNSKEDDLNKLKEVFKSEEQGYINRISNLECSLEDSFEDNERLQTVISTLGGRINVLEKTNRTNIKRFRTNYNYENNLQAVSNSNNFLDR